MAGTLFDRHRRNPAAGVARRSRRFPVDDLLEMISHHDPSVRAGALMVLGSHVRGDSRVLGMLVDTLRGDHSNDIRVQAVEKLGDLGDCTVVPALKEIARSETGEVRRAIAFAVATIQARDHGDT